MVLQSFAVVNAIFFLLCAYAFFQKDSRLLAYLLIVSCGLTGVVTFALTIWTPQKICGLFCVFYVALYSEVFRNCHRIVRQRITLAVVCISISLVTTYLLMPSSAKGAGAGLQSMLLRPTVQAYSYVSTLGVFVFIISKIHSPQRIDKLLALFFWTVVAAAAVGWLHFVFLKLGWAFIPIPRFNGSVSDLAAFGSREGVVRRVYAFSGEPKHLATLLLPGIFLQLFYYLMPGDSTISRKHALLALGFTFPVLLLTYSSGAYVSFALGVVIVSTLLLQTQPKAAGQLIGIAFLSGILLLLLIIFNEDMLASQIAHAKQRSVDRISSSIEHRLEYRTIRYMLVEQPESIPFGLGLGAYVFHGFGNVSRGGVQGMTSTWATMFADIGLIGTSAFMSLLVLPTQIGMKILKTTRVSGAFAGAYGGLIGAAVAGVATGSLYLVMIFAAILLSKARSLKATKIGTGSHARPPRRS